MTRLTTATGIEGRNAIVTASAPTDRWQNCSTSIAAPMPRIPPARLTDHVGQLSLNRISHRLVSGDGSITAVGDDQLVSTVRSYGTPCSKKAPLQMPRP